MIVWEMNAMYKKSAIDLRANPFFLSEEQIAWVYKRIAAMDTEEKVGQLFCVLIKKGDAEEYEYIFNILKPGGAMFRMVPTVKAVETVNELRRRTQVPLLIAANLEKGGNGIVEEGTLLGSPMEVAATNDVKYAELLARVCAAEGAAVGANWAFAPIIDIDNNFHNPITNTRTFGSDPQRVRDMGVTYVKTVQDLGFAASIKHFPGDGMDERDQHLVTSINSCTAEEWDESYGMVYRACIEAGAKTCMIGHILQPAWTKKLNPEIQDEDILPGSLSEELMQGLLRGHLGFNGLIVTDATTMAGFTLPMSRRLAVPTTIAHGADMFLFSRNLEEDYQFMLDGVHSGLITPERLDEAVTRILALKASLGLAQPQPELDAEKARTIVGAQQHLDWATACADRAITLVKEQPGVLPLTTKKYKRILFHAIEETGGASLYTVKETCRKVMDRLRAEGFEVDLFTPAQGTEGHTPKTTDTVGVYDLIVYVANLATKSNQTTVRINWAQPMGANCGHFINDVPTVFISLENPYHLFDFPRVKTYINCYCSSDVVIAQLMEKLCGRSTFRGISPVDPFCGKWDTHL